MKSNKLILILLLCMGINVAKAQQAVDAAGGNATGAGGSASYSVGQVAYTYINGSNGSSNQGVQQPYEFFNVGIDEHQDITLSMIVFPNPVQSTVTLSVENQSLQNLSFQLYDLSGKLLINQKINKKSSIS